MTNESLLNQKQRVFFRSGATLSASFRRQQLEALLAGVKKHEAEVLDALKADLGKCAYEGYIGEVGFVYEEIRFALKRLNRWMKPERARAGLLTFPARAEIHSDPRGVVLILSPWNYPFQLLFSPLVGSIAAGNCAVLKPSELSPATSAVIAKIIADTFHPDFIAVQEGGVESSQRLLELEWDYIFFTGGAQVGRVVMTAAAKYLTPVTLELGGKSPCLIDEDADLQVTSRRVAWGKFFNAGQTCVAPDYVLVQKNIKARLLEELKASITGFFGETPQASPDFGRIINARHFQRLVGYLNGKKPWMGGGMAEGEKYFPPTVLIDAKPGDAVMQEEIFGPILPILEYDTLDEAIQFIKARPKPLAFYFFSKNRSHQKQVLEQISFGGGCINDTLVHLTTPHLPFGGVGESGMGAYHGRFSFEVFSHRKSVLRKPFFGDLPLRYPPYRNKLSLIRRLVK